MALPRSQWWKPPWRAWKQRQWRLAPWRRRSWGRLHEASWKRWSASDDSLAWLLLQGAISSGASHCSWHWCSLPCMWHSPSGLGSWKCFTGHEAPQDALLRRHLWPRDERDLHLCTQFLAGMNEDDWLQLRMAYTVWYFGPIQFTSELDGPVVPHSIVYSIILL